jgi:hypothetical protein
VESPASCLVCRISTKAYALSRYADGWKALCIPPAALSPTPLRSFTEPGRPLEAAPFLHVGTSLRGANPTSPTRQPERVFGYLDATINKPPAPIRRGNSPEEIVSAKQTSNPISTDPRHPSAAPIHDTGQWRKPPMEHNGTVEARISAF